MNLSGLVSFLLVASLPALASGQGAPMPVATDFADGEQWNWHRIDGFTKLETAKSWRRSVVQFDGLSFLDSSNRVYSIKRIYQGRTFREWPLEIGKKWRHEFDWTSAMGEAGSTWENAEVVAYEDVTVPAGTFKAFRIEYKGNWALKIPFGVVVGNVSDVYWYAPDVKADVKQIHVSRHPHGEDQWTSELTSHELAQP